MSAERESLTQSIRIKSTEKIDHNFQFDGVFLKRFLKILSVLFPRWRDISVLLFIFLLAISLLEQVVVYNIGLVPSKYFKILTDEKRTQTTFTSHTFVACALIVAEAFIKSTLSYITSVLYITWREKLSAHLHTKYIQDILYYQVNVIDQQIDNPDQRITQDVDKMCDTFSQVLAIIIISPFTIGYYMYQCAIISGFVGPVSAIGFFIIATIINKLLMSPVVNFVFKQEKLEGDFRFKHMQIRMNSESAAFYHSGCIERTKTDARLHSLIRTQKQLIRREYALNFCINFSDYFGAILSYIAIAVPLFAGVYDDLSPSDLAELISKNGFVSIYLISCFTRLIDQALKTTDVAGTAHRIGELLERLGELGAKQSETFDLVTRPTHGDAEIDDSNTHSNYQISSRSSREAGFCAVKLRDVTYGAPGSRDIFCKGLNLEVVAGKNILVTGASGCGKSSLFRVIADIWPSVSGRVERNLPLGPHSLFFLPQKPYFTDGCLKQQVIYPYNYADSNTSARGVADDEIIQLLETVDLHRLVDRSGGLNGTTHLNWYEVMSPGEMQRLSFVRLFYHQPPFAFLDESTSQISVSSEQTMYRMCADRHITVISVGHRDSIRQYHDVELNLQPHGVWTLQTITPEREPSINTQL